MTRLLAAAAALCLLPVLSACDGGSSTPTAVGTPTTAATPTEPACPSVKVPPQDWPIEVPADVPRPPSAVISRVDHTNGVTIVRFDASLSLRGGIIYLLDAFKKANYVVGRGDAEPTEADAPFSRGNFRGVFRLVSTGDCSTTWLLAISPAKGGGQGPTLPQYTATSTASPLPFG